MTSIKGTLIRKAAKTTAKHSAHGTASKLRRDPMRTGTLLGIGCVAGVLGDRLVSRAAADSKPAAPGAE